MFRTTSHVRDLLRSNPGVAFTVKEIAEAIVENNPRDWEIRQNRADKSHSKSPASQLVSEIYNARLNLMRMNREIVEQPGRPLRLVWQENE